jgi:hypothetical protein
VSLFHPYSCSTEHRTGFTTRRLTKSRSPAWSRDCVRCWITATIHRGRSATEIGWPTYGIVDEELRARWLVRSALLLAGARRGCSGTRCSWTELTAFPPEERSIVPLRRPQRRQLAPTPKLAWQALVTLVDHASLAVTEDVTAELAGAPADARVSPGGSNWRPRGA